jgi:hypothetical protein
VSGTSSGDRHRRLRAVVDGVWAQLCADGTEPQPLLTAELALATASGPMRLARGQDGLPHLLVPLSAAPATGLLHRSSGLKLTAHTLLVNSQPQMFADLACLRGDVQEAFLSLVADACQRVAASPATPGDALVRSIEEWRALFAAPNEPWTRRRLAGLFGELTVLGRLLENHPRAAGTWTGPEGAAHDFRGPGQSLEVKATLGEEGRMVRIHGPDQLEAPEGSDLSLAWFRLTDSAPDGARNVRQLIETVLAGATDLTVLHDRIERLRLPDPGTSEVVDRKFVILEERWLRVDSGFPRIIPATFTGRAVPAGVTGLEYLVNLDVVPESSAVDPPSVLGQLGAGS